MEIPQLTALSKKANPRTRYLLQKVKCNIIEPILRAKFSYVDYFEMKRVFGSDYGYGIESVVFRELEKTRDGQVPTIVLEFSRELEPNFVVIIFEETLSYNKEFAPGRSNYSASKSYLVLRRFNSRDYRAKRFGPGFFSFCPSRVINAHIQLLSSLFDIILSVDRKYFLENTKLVLPQNFYDEISLLEVRNRYRRQH